MNSFIHLCFFKTCYAKNYLSTFFSIAIVDFCSCKNDTTNASETAALLNIQKTFARFPW